MTPRPPPLCTVDGVPLFVAMDAVRNLLPLSPVSDTSGNNGSSESKKAPRRNFDKELFWNGLVRAITEEWKKVDVSGMLTYTMIVAVKDVLSFFC